MAFWPAVAAVYARSGHHGWPEYPTEQYAPGTAAARSPPRVKVLVRDVRTIVPRGASSALSSAAPSRAWWPPSRESVLPVSARTWKHVSQ